MQKLRGDLEAVMERVVLCREMMQESPGIEQDETLAGVIGYLEACRDRLANALCLSWPPYTRLTL
jgi:hypothetical protein